LNIGQTAEELANLDKKVCPVCGISFYEFRQMGRLGCPHDYTNFKRELDPLILNVHGSNHHVGKVPVRNPGERTRQTELIRMRREMREAIEAENYELASSLRDQIRHNEKELAP